MLICKCKSLVYKWPMVVMVLKPTSDELRFRSVDWKFALQMRLNACRKWLQEIARRQSLVPILPYSRLWTMQWVNSTQFDLRPGRVEYFQDDQQIQTSGQQLSSIDSTMGSFYTALNIGLLRRYTKLDIETLASQKCYHPLSIFYGIIDVLYRMLWGQ